MKLITELNETSEYIQESRGGVKQHFIQGIFLQAGVKNRNGRIYPIDVMEREVSRYTKERVEAGRAYGELGHPSGPQINLERVSHMIVDLSKEGDNYVGKALIAETPMGDIARGLLKSGAKLGVSSRGIGTLIPTKEGIMEVQDDFRLATAADIVADPSAPDAFVNGIMENVEWIYDSAKNTYLEQHLDDVKKAVHSTPKKRFDEGKALAIFENYLSLLRNTHR
jgi:hypothetical protein